MPQLNKPTQIALLSVSEVSIFAFADGLIIRVADTNRILRAIILGSDHLSPSAWARIRIGAVLANERLVHSYHGWVVLEFAAAVFFGYTASFGVEDIAGLAETAFDCLELAAVVIAVLV